MQELLELKQFVFSVLLGLLTLALVIWMAVELGGAEQGNSAATTTDYGAETN